MDIQGIDNGWMAFLAGVISSPHCVVMCGPIAFMLLSTEPGSKPRHTYQAIYHTSRILSFAIFGMLAGGLGLGLVAILQFPPVKVFPWVLVAFFFLFGVGADKWLPKPKWLSKFFQRISRFAFKIKKPYAALTLGLATPILPCGPLYMIFWVALLSGSPLIGGEIALGYGLGTLPLMWLAQYPIFALKKNVSWVIISFLKRFLALAGAFLITWRVLSVNGPLSAEFCCPF
ncbi:MAG: hypothetical protein COZ46_04700 [Verrucomicrobia bacterium CG_4_10_14_3_um_filter_43_23]|nr:MAG: hypothetical protein COX01_08025 [Verrucomicrobia bacterium CG22_combo_CG10-13_8_21_14_all_43_17]PIX58284.1 MAG: hypothetical protein COZ46_04700 [Verrucomicrobia bacterium CG_4_10_14_3_um_filter_43_23]PIY60794.1 MAG: hypothetical protein COY94_08615 [Verrucomicrobia bacterium CG_4_10_14_0_8_um_filter_43_34]PJA44281.1 MAG: hypothetical protein CO175_03730 [Verrucomicrobia bacterium CG_4_9_14_3_um_filter_43_20]